MDRKLLLFFIQLFFLTDSYCQKLINIRDFGVLPSISDNENSDMKKLRWERIDKAFHYCIKNRVDLFIPKGVYDVGNSNFPFRVTENNNRRDLLDCGGIMIYGESGTILKTSSEDGADVLQLNKLSNISFSNLEITATIHSGSKHGTNGISITNGFDNILLNNIKIYNLPGVVYGDYIDGGKGLTVQFEKNSKYYKGKLTAKNIDIKNCPYGFRLDAVTLSDVINNRDNLRLDLDIVTTNAYQGFAIDIGEPFNNIDLGKRLNIVAKAKLIDCQQYIRLSRVIGGRFEFDLNANNKYLQYQLNDPISFALLCNYVKFTNIKVSGRVNYLDKNYIIGAVGAIYEPFNLKNRTEHSIFDLKLLGTPKEEDFTIIEFNGNSIHDSEFRFLKSSFNTTKSLRRIYNKNKIVYN
ncbi:hypothetical protein [Sphingobacterium luzhongxinii]|uniref:hypothetical protein n=1 Tax=Sphingobacterium luzhongxinii TaxID=2654181 RepID=UPI0013DCCE1F|nr:hypothetical protein [Sphingobacterium sp. xlx-73]